MRSRGLLWLLVPLLLLGQGVILTSAVARREQLPGRGETLYALPSPLLKAMVLEYDGIVSDFIFLRTLVFIGGTFERAERPRVRPQEWDWIRDSLIAATDLDPWFSDPYYLANSEMVWDAGRVLDANLLLEKGVHYRTWDWLPPFMAGFNYYYFLHDNAKAAPLLMESARRPGASPVIATLAARLANASDQTNNAITFLEEMYQLASDDMSRNLLHERLTALLDIQALEKAVAMYRERNGVLPERLENLVTAGVLVRIPVEPYGGRYRLESDGRVVSSSDFGKRAE
ncbi:MAG: hypothetical protein IBX47_01775 [Desulfuromonadales bacterium]|nr:hypothetical protein [Desulfuromonadales bacterium]